MPAVLTHYKFYELCGNTSDIGFLGAQGPDPFFFRGLGVIPKYSKQRKFGTYLHEIDPYLAFSYYIDYIKNCNNNKEKNILTEFVLGLLAHYTLDRICHPYIWYTSGFATKNDNDIKYKTSHARIESAIDTLIMDKYHDNRKPYNALPINRNEVLIVSKMFKDMPFELCKDGSIDELTYYQSIKDMKTVDRILYSRHGHLKHYLDKKYFNTPLSSMCEPQLIDIDKDYLNFDHRKINSCTTNEYLHSKDFMQLISDAIKTYEIIKKDILDVINNKKEKEDLKLFFNEINHNGFNYKEKFKYHDCIYKNI